MRFSLFTVTLLTLIVVSLSISISNAQTSNFTDGELDQLRERLSSDYMISKKSRKVIGDPYLNEDFIRGFVQINDKAKTDVLFLRFNTEKNIVEFTRGDNYYGIDSNKIDGFTLLANPRDIVFKNGFKSDKHDIKNATLLRVIYDGKTKLVAHHTTSLKENLPTYGSATQKDEYVDNIKFYIVRSAGKFFETKLKRKDILKTLDEKKRDQISDYAKQKNLDFDEEADLAIILKYYDEIKSGS